MVADEDVLIYGLKYPAKGYIAAMVLNVYVRPENPPTFYATMTTEWQDEDILVSTELDEGHTPPVNSAIWWAEQRGGGLAQAREAAGL